MVIRFHFHHFTMLFSLRLPTDSTISNPMVNSYSSYWPISQQHLVQLIHSSWKHFLHLASGTIPSPEFPPTSFTIFLKDFIYLFLNRGEGREGNINVWLPLTCPLLGAWPTNQARALTGNRTGNPLVLRLALNPLRHTSQGYYFFSGSFAHTCFCFQPLNVEESQASALAFLSSLSS